MDEYNKKQATNGYLQAAQQQIAANLPTAESMQQMASQPAAPTTRPQTPAYDPQKPMGGEDLINKRLNPSYRQSELVRYQMPTPDTSLKANALGTASQPVTYIDDAGQKQTGVAAATAEAQAAAQEPEQEPAGELSYWDRMRQYYQEMYDAQVAANNTAAANAAAQALDNTNRQIEALQQQYAGTNKELYRNYMNQQRLLPQQLASQGYSGGMSESARLRLGTSYEETLNGNQQALANEQTALNAAYTQAQYEAQAAADAANAQALQQRYGYLAQLEGEQQAQLAEKAQNMAAVGDYSGFLELGYDQSQVDTMTRMWLQEHPELWNTWVKSNPETAKRLGIKKRTTASYGGGGSQPTKADYVTSYNRYLAAGDEEAAANVLAEYNTSSAYNGQDLGSSRSAADYAYWANMAG